MHLQMHLQTAAAVCALLMAFTERADPMDVIRWPMSRMVREVRFTRFNLTMHPSMGTVPECGIRSVRNKHTLHFRINFTRAVTDMNMILQLYKCKEYYVDCENVVSNNITNGCSKLDQCMYYLQHGYHEFEKTVKCPLLGEYCLSNFTVKAEEFRTLFSYPTERWWELYWRLKSFELGITNPFDIV